MKKCSFIFTLLLSLLFVSCDNSIEKPELTSIKFEKDSIKVNVGQSTACNLITGPEGCEIDEELISYNLIPDDICELQVPDSKGCVLKGLINGSGVLSVKYNNYVSYLQIEVEGEKVSEEPYLTLSESDLKMELGKSRRVVANLVGADSNDIEKFSWQSSDPSIVSVESAGSTAVLTSKKYGNATVTVSNEASLYDASMLVIVPEKEGDIFYLTTEENVLTVEKGESIDFKVECYGGDNDDLSQISYKIISGNDYFEISGAGSLCSVKALSEGQGMIEVIHPKSKVSLKVLVNVISPKEEDRIICDNDFIVFSSKESKNVEFSLLSKRIGQWSYEKGGDDCIDVIQYNNSILINPLKEGICTVIITNSLVKDKYEIRIVVEDIFSTKDFYSIRTESSVIKIEEGEKDIPLIMELLGGEEFDSNGFEWKVGDSEVIKLDAVNGKVIYSRAAENIKITEGKAFINAENTGHTTIEVSHPKSENSIIIDVFVYPKGTFNKNREKPFGKTFVTAVVGIENEYLISGVYEKSLMKVSSSDESVLNCYIKDDKIFYKAIKSGNAILKIDSELFENTFSVNVFCGTEAEINGGLFLSCKDSCIKGSEGNSVNFEIEGNNVNQSVFDVICDDNSICDVGNIGNIFSVKMKKAGSAVLRISCLGFSNVLYIPVYCYPKEVTSEYPYYFSGDSFFETYKGEKKSIPLIVNGCPDGKEMDCSFDYDSSKLRLSYNEKNIISEGLSGGQGIIQVSHPRVFEKKEINYIVYETKEEKENGIFLWTDKKIYQGKEGEKLLIKVNSSKTYSGNLNIELSDIESCNVNTEGNYILLELKKRGTVNVKCFYDSKTSCMFDVNILPENTVNEGENGFSVPSLITAVKGKSSYIPFEYYGKCSSADIKFICDSDLFATLSDSSLRFMAEEKKNYRISFECEKYGLVKDTVIVVYETEEEKDKGCCIYPDSYEYYVYEGNETDINLKVTNESILEEIKASVKWEKETDSNGIKVYENGINAKIKAVREGEYKIKVSSDKADNSFIINIYVRPVKVESENNFNFSRRVFIKKGEAKSFTYQILKSGVNENDYQNVNVYSENTGIDSSVNSNIISLYSNAVGDYLCTLKKSGINDYKFLVCCRENTVNENEPYLFLSSDICVLEKGAKDNIEVYKNEGEDFTLSVQGDECIEIAKNEEGFTVKAIKSGRCTVKVLCQGLTKELTVKVSGEIKTYENDIKGESVIFIEKGKVRETSVQAPSTVTFFCNNKSLNIESQGNTAKLSSSEKGVYELKVSLSDSNYVISRVYVYENGENISDISLFNIYKRVYEVSEGESIFFQPYIGKGDYQNISFNTDCSDFCDVKLSNGIFTVQGKKEGYCILKVSYNSEIINVGIYIKGKKHEVYESKADKGSYLSAVNSYEFVCIDDAVILKTSAFDFKGNYKTISGEYIWRTDNNDIVTLTQFSNECAVRGLKKGRAVIWCSNGECENIVSFTVDCGTSEDRYRNEHAYIYTQSSVVTIDYAKKTAEIEARLNNIKYEFSSDIKISFENEGICTATYAVENDRLLISLQAVKCGKTVMKISSPKAEFDTNITVIVNYEIKGETPYITTSNNYTLIRRGQTKRISVRLKNISEYDPSSFTWKKISGGECCTIIGNGESVQVYGINEGLCHIEVSHSKSSSSIDLYVMVDDSAKEVKYITTENRVIETTVSSQMDSFKCEIVGSVLEDEGTFNFTVDRSDVLSVMQSGNTFFYRGLKEGNAKVHVSNVQSGCVNELDVVFIVKSGETGPAMKMNTTAIYMKKGESGKTVTAEFLNTGAVDENIIDWFIYSSLPSKSYKEVVTLTNSGKTCVIKPVGEGYASVRAYYEPLGISASVGIYVDEVGKVSFKKEDVSVDKGTSIFVEMNVPSYIDDISSYITYKSMDESICSAFGTGKVCCIEGKEEGSCIVRAENSYDKTICEIGVTVVKTEENNPQIIVRKNTLLLNPRSEDQVLEAYVSGRGIGREKDDGLIWEIESDQSGCLSLYPSKGDTVQLKLNPCSDLSDSAYGRVKCGQAIIKVSHPDCPVYKTIYVNISELDNFFTLDKYSMNLGISQTDTLKCSIAGGRESDYANVKWSVNGQNTDQFGARVDVCRAMVSEGKETTLYGLNEGTCIVTAFYLGYAVTCEVQVTTDRIFRLNGASNIKMFPDISDDNYTDVSYICRPQSQVPQWSVQNETGDSSETYLIVEQLSGNEKIRLRPNGKEGRVKVIGFVVGCGQVSFTVDLQFQPEINIIEGDLDYNILLKEDGTNEQTFKFSSYPSQYYVGLSKTGKYADYVQAFIEETHKSGDQIEGTVKFKILKEFPTQGCILTLQQYRDSTLSDYSKVSGGDSKLNITVSGYYNDDGITLGFRRGQGGFSLRKQTQSAIALYNVDDKFINSGNNSYFKFYDSLDNNQNKTIDLADSENHYFIMKKRHENAFMENISITVESSNATFTDKDIDGSKMLLLDEGWTYNQGTINTMAKKAFPKVNKVEIQGDGSVIFDIKTGNKDEKYGINWNVKKTGSEGDHPDTANRYHCPQGSLNGASIKVDGYTVYVNSLYFDCKEWKGKKIYYFNIPGLPYSYVYAIRTEGYQSYRNTLKNELDSSYGIQGVVSNQFLNSSAYEWNGDYRRVETVYYKNEWEPPSNYQGSYQDYFYMPSRSLESYKNQSYNRKGTRIYSLKELQDMLIESDNVKFVGTISDPSINKTGVVALEPAGHLLEYEPNFRCSSETQSGCGTPYRFSPHYEGENYVTYSVDNSLNRAIQSGVYWDNKYEITCKLYYVNDNMNEYYNKRYVVVMEYNINVPQGLRRAPFSQQEYDAQKFYRLFYWTPNTWSNEQEGSEFGKDQPYYMAINNDDDNSDSLTGRWGTSGLFSQFYFVNNDYVLFPAPQKHVYHFPMGNGQYWDYVADYYYLNDNYGSFSTREGQYINFPWSTLPNMPYWADTTKHPLTDIQSKVPEDFGYHLDDFYNGDIEMQIYKVNDIDHIGSFIPDHEFLYDDFYNFPKEKIKCTVTYYNSSYPDTYIFSLDNQNLLNTNVKDAISCPLPYKYRFPNEYNKLYDTGNCSILNMTYKEFLEKYPVKYGIGTLKVIYSNKEKPDFRYQNINLIIKWKDRNNNVQEKEIPLNLYFYDNKWDYYTYDGNEEKHPLDINPYINQIDFKP